MVSGLHPLVYWQYSQKLGTLGRAITITFTILPVKRGIIHHLLLNASHECLPCDNCQTSIATLLCSVPLNPRSRLYVYSPITACAENRRIKVLVGSIAWESTNLEFQNSLWLYVDTVSNVDVEFQLARLHTECTLEFPGAFSNFSKGFELPLSNSNTFFTNSVRLLHVKQTE